MSIVGGLRVRRAVTLTALGLLSVSATAMTVEAAPVAARAQVAKKKRKKKHASFTVKVTGGTMTLAFTAPAWAVIDGGSPTVGTVTSAVAPATATGTGTFTLPIGHGSLNSATGRGTVDATGGLAIESHVSLAGLFESSSSATASNPVALLSSSSQLSLTSANFNPSTVPMFALNIAHVKVVGSRHSVTLSAIPATLTAPGVEFFGSSFQAGEQIATVTIAAKG